MAEAVAGRRERKKEETKQKIFLAAVGLFTEKGFDATTVDEIADRADVAKGTFFNYFPRKEALLHYLAESWLETAEDTVAQTDRSAEERIVELFVMAAESFGENRELARTVARFSMEQICAPTAETAGTHLRIDGVLDELWRQGQTGGEFRADVEPALARGVMGATFIGAVTWWVGGPDGRVDPCALDVGLPELIRTHLALVFDGLRSRGGGRS
jgi:AcrR family transcriptional regulator